jgi:hypothetical protein
LENLPCFSFAKNALVFTLIKNRVFFFFCYCLFHFCLDLHSDLYIYLSRCIFCLWTMLVYLKRVGFKKFKWCWKREIALCKKVVQEGACVDCGLGFCMSCLMYFW